MPKKVSSDLSLADLISLVNKQTKVQGFLASGEEVVIEDISTGIPELDVILHRTGWPRGRFSEIMGEFSTGKTWVVLKTIAAAQKQGFATAFVDVEKTFDPDWSTKVGIDNSRLALFRPNTGEQALDVVIALLQNNVDLIAIDSIAALLPTSEEEESMEKQTIGLQARMVGKGLRKITSANNRSVVLAINQVRSGIGGYVVKEALPGGKSQEFFASIILRVHRQGFIREGGEEDKSAPRIGMYIEATTIKNKVGPPFQTCTIPMLYTGDIDTVGMVFQSALDLGIIEKLTQSSYLVEGEKVVGKLGVLNYLKGNSLVVESLRAKIINA